MAKIKAKSGKAAKKGGGKTAGTLRAKFGRRGGKALSHRIGAALGAARAGKTPSKAAIGRATGTGGK